MKLLLDTHFLLWSVLDLPRMDDFPWLDRYRPWGVSPVSLLELKFLSEAGRLELRDAEFVEALRSDSRFTLDEVPLTGALDEPIGGAGESPARGSGV